MAIETLGTSVPVLRGLWWLGAFAAVVTLTFGGCFKENDAAHISKKQSDPVSDWVQTAVVGEIKAKSDSGHDRIQALESPSAGAYVVTLAGDTESTVYAEEDLLRSASAQVIGRIFGYATDNETPIQLTLIWMLPARDGVMHAVMKIEITRETAKRWIWKRVYPDALPGAVNQYEYTPLK